MIHCLQSLVLFIATIGSSSDLIYYLVLLLLLLLSGDVELNPGPMIDDQPTSDLFVKYLAEPLDDDWEPFALCLPGIIQQDIDEIKTKGNFYLRMKALHERWLEVYPHASWRYVINALKECENDLHETIKQAIIGPSFSEDDVPMITKPGHITTGNPKDILRTHSNKIRQNISTNMLETTYALYAKGLIPDSTKQEMLELAIKDGVKAAQLTNAIEQQLKSSENPGQYLIDVCHVFEKEPKLKDITKSMISELILDDSNDRVGYLSCPIARGELKPGDHIHVHVASFYTHHGIYIGEDNCEMIHFSGESESKEIKITTLDKFCEGFSLKFCLVAYNCSKVTKVSSLFHSASCHVEKAMPLSETVKLALHFLYHPKEWGNYEEWKQYDLGSEPSEIFACFCKTGLLKIAAQYQWTRWVHIFRNMTNDTHKEALEKYRIMKREIAKDSKEPRTD